MKLTIFLVLCGLFALAAAETHHKSKNVTKDADAKKESNFGVLKIGQNVDVDQKAKPLSYTSYNKAYASKKKQVKTPEPYKEKSYEKESYEQEEEEEEEEEEEYAEENQYDKLVQMEGGPAYEKPVEYEKKTYDYVPAFKPLVYGELGRRQEIKARLEKIKLVKQQHSQGISFLNSNPFVNFIKSFLFQNKATTKETSSDEGDEEELSESDHSSSSEELKQI